MYWFAWKLREQGLWFVIINAIISEELVPLLTETQECFLSWGPPYLSIILHPKERWEPSQR